MSNSTQRGRKPRNKNIPCSSDRDGNTQKLYAMAVDRFFSGIKDKDEQFKVLTDDEEKELIERYKDDRPEMERQLVTHNIFLAIGFASKQQYRFTDHDELISLSIYGLMEAAKKFDPSKGWRFNTYAVWYLKRNVLRQFYVKKEYIIGERTAIFLDDSKMQNGDENDDYAFASLNSQMEPTLTDNYRSPSALDNISFSEHEQYMRDMLTKVVDTVANSSLSETDKKIFNLSCIEGENLSTISKELGISYVKAMDGRKRVLDFINENFSKEEIFAA